MKTASEMTSIVSGGALNSTQTKPNCGLYKCTDLLLISGHPVLTFFFQFVDATAGKVEQRGKSSGVEVLLRSAEKSHDFAAQQSVERVG